MEQSQLDLNGIYEIEYLDNLVRLFGSSFIDEKSFYSPIEGKKEFHPQELIEAMPDVELRQEKLRKMAEKMQRILSPERIERFVEEQLGDRAKSMRLSFRWKQWMIYQADLCQTVWFQKKDAISD